MAAPADTVKEMVMSEWRPIETAPKAGETILLFFPETDTVIDGHWGHTVMMPEEDNPEHWEWDTLLHWSGMRDEMGEPSHWMPLPTPPHKESADE